MLGTAVAVAAFSMFGWMFQMSSHAGSYEDRVRSAIRVPAEDIGFIYIDADLQANKEISGKIAELSEIEACGTMNYGVFNTNEAVAFLGEVQKGHQKAVRDEDYATGRGIETCVMSEGAWDIMNMKLSSGKAPEEFVFNENTVLLYLSEEYRDIAELGEHFYEIYEKDGSVIYDYEVAGFLSGGSRVLADGVGNSVDELINRGYYTTEYAIIEVTDSPFLSGGYFAIKDGESFETVRENIPNKPQPNKADIPGVPADWGIVIYFLEVMCYEKTSAGNFSPKSYIDSHRLRNIQWRRGIRGWWKRKSHISSDYIRDT